MRSTPAVDSCPPGFDCLSIIFKPRWSATKALFWKRRKERSPMLSTAIGLIVLLFHLAGIVAALNAVMNTRTAQGAFAWALGLVLLPYITLIPYLYLGRSRFRGYINRHRASRLQSREAAGVLDGADASDATEAMRYQAIANLLDTRFYAGHRLRLMVDGDAIGKAQHYALVQFFIFHDDELGRRMQALLLERAAAGVKVCVLFDGIGSHALPKNYIKTLCAGGVMIHAFT